MKKNLVTEEQVKEILKVDEFGTIREEKLIEFVTLIPQMDKEVAVSIINQFSSYADTAKYIIGQLKEMCETIIKENSSSQKDVVQAYMMVLDELGELLKQKDISENAKLEITDKMIAVADKIAIKDTETKQFLADILKVGGTIVGGTLILGAVILGTTVVSGKIPIINKN